MTELAEIVDAVVGGDTHRDSHALEMLTPTGTTIAVLSISNDEDGFAEAIAWIAEHSPGPRIVVGLEGTRSYGIGLARAAAAAGLIVTEIQAPGRSARRGRGKSDPIDARMAALQLLRMPAGELPVPRADGDREALRILLGARRELTITRTRQVNRLRALLLSGDDGDRVLSRGTLTDARLQAIARRRGSGQSTEQAVRRAEARRWLSRSAPQPPSSPPTSASSPCWSALSPRRCWPRSGSDPSPPPRLSCPGLTAAGAAMKPRSPRSPAPVPLRPAAAARPVTVLTAAVTGSSTAPCMTSA